VFGPKTNHQYPFRGEIVRYSRKTRKKMLKRKRLVRFYALTDFSVRRVHSTDRLGHTQRRSNVSKTKQTSCGRMQYKILMIRQINKILDRC